MSPKDFSDFRLKIIHQLIHDYQNGIYTTVDHLYTAILKQDSFTNPEIAYILYSVGVHDGASNPYC
jgi:hypothetical protein